MNNGFLPLSKEDMRKKKIEQFDFVYVIGDAMWIIPLDAIISRLLAPATLWNYFTTGLDVKESIAIYGEPACIFSKWWKYGFHGKSL